MGNKNFEDLSLTDDFLVLSMASDLKCGPECVRLLAEGKIVTGREVSVYDMGRIY